MKFMCNGRNVLTDIQPKASPHNSYVAFEFYMVQYMSYLMVPVGGRHKEELEEAEKEEAFLLKCWYLLPSILTSMLVAVQQH